MTDFLLTVISRVGPADGGRILTGLTLHLQ